MKAYKLNYSKIKTIADLKKILAMADLTFGDNGTLEPIMYMLKEVPTDLVDFEEVEEVASRPPLDEV